VTDAVEAKLSIFNSVNKLALNGLTADAEMGVILKALANNRGLAELGMQTHCISDDNWSVLCESVKAHATLTSLDLRNTRPGRLNGDVIMLSDEQKTHRTRELAEMVKRSTSLHTIRLTLADNGRAEQIYIQEILPYLSANCHRPRVLVVKKINERLFREKVLGRVFHCVSTDPNLVWMFLSENVDAFVRSEEEEEESHSEVAAAVAVVVAAEVLAGSKRKR
jgi:hypothetical protein